jgi:hypothetical protein
MIAFDSDRTAPSGNTTIGTRPAGFRARNSGVRVPPPGTSTSRQIAGRPRWAATHFTLRQFPEPGSP